MPGIVYGLDTIWDRVLYGLHTRYRKEAQLTGVAGSGQGSGTARPLSPCFFSDRRVPPIAVQFVFVLVPAAGARSPRFFPCCDASGAGGQELGCVACGFDWQGAAS